MRIVRRLLIALLVATGVTGGLVSAPASAEPGTTPLFPGNATATTFSGLAFDQCTAPALAAMSAWTASPYRAVGIYLSGASRTCAQPQLTASWVYQLKLQGWRFLPIHKGLQPPCGGRATDPKISLSTATARAQGEAAANEAIAAATALGLLPGSAVYNDIENYSTTDSACRTAVLTYLSYWTKRLHYKGWVSGVYVNLSSGAQDLDNAYTSTAYARPDAIWIARYDAVASTTGWAGIPDSRWPLRQRAKQYVGNSAETYGGTTITIDRDVLDAPVASVTYPHLVTSTTALNSRTAPSGSAPVVASYAPGSRLLIVCQTPGSAVGSTKVWNKLTNGSYVSDLYVDTTSETTYSPPIARCTYPYGITAASGVTSRTGPGTSYATAGTIPTGALAYVTCQRTGTAVGGTSVWDKLIDGRWVSDAAVATLSATSWSAPIPRC